MQQTINANLADCIHHATSIGGVTYYNICNHTTQWVPWGSMEFIGYITFGLFFLTALIMLIGAVFTVCFKSF